MPSPTYVPVIATGRDLSVADVTASGEVTSSTLRLTSTSDVGPASTTHAFQIGSSASTNIRMDANEIMVISNGAVANLNVQTDGGTFTLFGNRDANAVTDVIRARGVAEVNALEVNEGASTMGAATLVAGAATVSSAQVLATSRIFLTSQVDGGTPGWLRVSARVNATSFTITSSSATDTSTVAWLIVNPA
jgi:hypothetical protein